MMLIGPILTIAFFHLLRENNFHPDLRVPLGLMTVFAVSPILMMLTGIDLDFYLSESFRGLASSRTDYTLAASLAVLIAIGTRSKFLFCLPVLCVGIAFAASRTCMIALTVGLATTAVSAWHKSRDFRPTLLALAAVAMILLTPLFATQYVCRVIVSGASHDGAEQIADIGQKDIERCRGGAVMVREVAVVDDSGGRLQIYANAIEAIKQRWAFGTGSFYSTVTYNDRAVEPHNSILQSSLNFGIVVAALWLLISITVFFQTEHFRSGNVGVLVFIWLFPARFRCFSILS